MPVSVPGPAGAAGAAGTASFVLFDEGAAVGTATAGLNAVGAGVAGTVTSGTAILTVSGSSSAELDYAQVTSNTSPTATTEATANTIVTGNAVAYDGSTVVIIEFFSAQCRPDVGAAGRSLSLWLYDGASSIGQIGFLVTPAAASSTVPVRCAVRITPSSATHTYSIRASVSAGTGLVAAGAGGAGVNYPAFIRITRA